MAIKQWKTNEHNRRIGEDHPLSVLTDHEVDVMRSLHEDYAIPVNVLAEKFGVHRNTASRIVNYRVRNQCVREKEK